MDLSSQLATNKNEISDLFLRMRNFEDRLQKATASSQTPQPDLSTLGREFIEFKTSVLEILTKLAGQIDLLTIGQDRHEMSLRRKVLLFHGVAETKDEKVSEVILKVLTDQMKLPDITCNDFQSTHRLGNSSKKPRPILVRFRDYEVRRLAWESKTELKSTGIVVSEFLTKSRHDVFMAARKHFGVRNCWSSEGKIVVILPDQSRKKLETASELDALTAAFPAAADASGDRKPPQSTPATSPPAPTTIAGKPKKVPPSKPSTSRTRK